MLATIHQHFTKNTRTALKPVFTAQGRKTLAQLKGPVTFLAKFTFTPSSGRPVTSTVHFKLTPAASEQPTRVVPATSGRITSVQFSGSPANPSITVRGTNLGKLPQPSPAGHPSGQNGCPAIAGDKGYDYGTSLYIAVPAKNWSGGRYRPSPNETDCIDLVVTKFTPTQVDFQFGAPYKQFYPKFALDPGDSVQIAVNRATFTTTVRYG